MGYKILIATPPSVPDSFQTRFGNCVKKAVADQLDGIQFVSNIGDFQTLVSSLKFNVAIMIDDVGMGTEYSQHVSADVLHAGVNCIVIVPRRCHKSVFLMQLLKRGFYNALLECDVIEAVLGRLIRLPRSFDEAVQYYGLGNGNTDSRMEIVTQGTSEFVVRPVTEPVLQTKQLANGLKVTRMSAADAKRLARNVIGEDEVVGAFLNNINNLDLFLQQINVERMPRMEFECDPDWVDNCKKELRKYFQKDGLHYLRSFVKGDVEEDEFTKIVHKRLVKHNLDEDSEKKVYESFMKDTLSYGKLDVVINTPDITDIRLLGKDCVNVQHKGVWYQTNIAFSSDEEYKAYIHKLCTKNHVAVNVQQAQLLFADIDTNPHARLRFMVTHGLLNADHRMTAHIRKVDKVKKGIAMLVRDGLFSLNQAGFIAAAFSNKKSIVVCGGSGSGKTVLVNNMLSVIYDGVCGICMQETDELFDDNKINMEWQHSISGTGEGKVEHSLLQITTNGLLKNSALYIIGEVKGREARDLFSASDVGAQCICTTHTDAFYEAIPRLGDLASYNKDYSQQELTIKFSRTFDYVMHMQNYHVEAIAGVVGWDEQKQDVIYDLYEFE